MKLYISGPITGLPDCNREALMDAEKRPRDIGYEVITPVRTTLGPDAARHDYMRSAMRQIADGLAQPEGWNHSPGAHIEAGWALTVKIPSHDVDTGIEKRRFEWLHTLWVRCSRAIADWIWA